MNKSILKRETSVLERIMYWQGSRNPVNFAFRLLVQGRLAEPEIAKGFAQVQIDFTHLQARVVFQKDHTQWITNEAYNKIKLTRLENDTPWYELEEQLIAMEFPYLEGPPVLAYFRTIHDETEIILIVHHASIDGIAAVQIAETLLKHLADPEYQQQSQPFSTPLHELIPADIVNDFKTRTLPEWLTEQKADSYSRKIQPFQKTSFKIHPFVFDQTETEKIISACKEHQTTVHAYLGAALLSAFAQHYGKEQGYTRSIQSPLNFRPFIDPPLQVKFRPPSVMKSVRLILKWLVG